MKTTNPQDRFNLKQQDDTNLAAFKAQLDQQAFWQVVKKSADGKEEITGLLDSKTLAIYPPVSALETFLKEHPFLYLREEKDDKNLATLHTQTKLLWHFDGDGDDLYTLEEGIEFVKQGKWVGLNNWQLPSLEQLKAFALASGNPHRTSTPFRLVKDDYYFWLTTDGKCDVDEGCWDIWEEVESFIFSCNSAWVVNNTTQLLLELIISGWYFITPDNEKSFPKPQNTLSYEALLADLASKGEYLAEVNSTNESAVNYLKPETFILTNQLEKLDYTPCRLPKLDAAQLSDPEKGLWELWGQDAATLKEFNLVARDPSRDIQRRAVAIDFGTSSTVVAMDTASGARELLRIGTRDFYQAVEAKHFENPTVLECLDFSAFNKVWQSQAYRPE